MDDVSPAWITELLTLRRRICHSSKRRLSRQTIPKCSAVPLRKCSKKGHDQFPITPFQLILRYITFAFKRAFLNNPKSEKGQGNIKSKNNWAIVQITRFTLNRPTSLNTTHVSSKQVETGDHWRQHECRVRVSNPKPVSCETPFFFSFFSEKRRRTEVTSHWSH